MKNIHKFNKVPNNSIINRNIKGGIHYVDTFRIEITNTNDYSVDYLTALFFTSIPEWARMLLKVRDIIVKPFGLEIEIFPEQETLEKSLYYNVGKRAILFSVIDRSETEIVMAEDDIHLYFRTSLFVEETSDQNRENVYLTTLVQFHNIWGKLYFLPVKPFHKLIMKALLTNFSKRFN